MFNIDEELKKLPAKPGVYIMHGEKDEIIYIGKAIILKNRVRQYFQSSRNKSPKIEQMVSHIQRFEYIITDSELEALVLECNLIKEHRPRYNTMLKDDKSYPYIKVTVGEEYPRILFSRDMKKDKSKYYGPYTSAGAVKDTLELLRKLYQIRTCNRNLPRDIGKDRPCLNYHIKQCKAPCQGYIPKEEYRESIQKAMDFLNGNYDEILKNLEEKMMAASEAMEYEEAMEYRDLLNSVKQIAQKQKITSNEMEDRDVIACSSDGSDAVVQVFFIRGGKLIGREHFHLTVSVQDEKGQILGSFIKQYYAGTPFIPRELMLQASPDDEELLAEWLSAKKGQKVYIRVPKKGQKERLVELAFKNASMVLEQDREKIKREEMRTKGALHQIEEWLDLSGISRIEAFDISNTSGMESVGSMIVYEEGKPKRSDYRKFKIRTVIGPDDYASMEEVLKRRFEHGLEELRAGENSGFGSFTRFPDLIMMDGGRGQVNVALKVLEELKLNIPVCGMVKDDNHRTRGLYYDNVEIPIERNSEGFRLITRIQDEAHRFAIEYHRSLRSKEQVHSILDDIDGIGTTRRRALMKYFKGLEEIRSADVETLKDVPSMNELAARKVYDFFHKPQTDVGQEDAQPEGGRQE
ncbi:MAG: excinuclease ABC subunit UvrC [Lachnospiraceae bacterium]|nr:excinuclease ABC subunit UvrC [Lachnospiraceae bacterium]